MGWKVIYKTSGSVKEVIWEDEVVDIKPPVDKPKKIKKVADGTDK